ncbi:MAG: hypothetical protein ILO68_07780, partial [Clostridia bacterium]|nr:hypothetical protein [Clostridia bacterium]
SGTGESGQPDASDRKRRDGIVFTSEEQAEPIMDLALAEFQGLMRADKQTRYSDRIYAKYYNNYLLPYLEMLSSQQTVVEPGTGPSNWFPKGTDGIRSLIQSSYGNMYRKIAQDMLPYMLPDPDELLKSIAACCGGSSTVVDQRLDIDQMKQDYQKYADNWETMHYFDLLKSDWGTYWEDNLWAGTSYDFGNVWVGFCSPKYNRQKLVNLAVFGDKIEDDKREAFLPYSTANALLTEIQDARSKGGEFYIQNFTVTVKGTSEIASARLRDIFELFFPHASEAERSAWYAEMLSGETKHAFVYSVDHGFRFDKYINCYVENDYSFVMPSFGQYDGAQPRFGTEYRVDINDWYTNRTCDSYMKLGINTTHASQEEVYMTLKVEIGGKDILPTNLYRDADVFYCTNYQCNYGVFYPILAPFYYSEAVNSGCFTPYVISEPFAEDDIPIAPEYTAPKTEKTLADVIGDGTGEHGPTQETKWLSDGFGNDYHDFPPRNDPTSPQDLEKLGYKQNADGNWVRTLPTKDNEVSHTLIYDGDGVLRESERKYDTGTTRRSTY